MPVIAFILLGSVVLLPAAALLALRWAATTGQFRCTDKAALLPFDDVEPVGFELTAFWEETAVEHDQTVANTAAANAAGPAAG